MEKTNKYYSVIEKLVKEHKKYEGSEEFLEDIIDDVYSHSEVVINSIADESVIDAYLSKVVNTSIITVPKRLGKAQAPENKEPEPIQEIFRRNNVNIELVDKMINSAPKKVEEIEDVIPIKDEVIELPEQEENVSCFEELDVQTEMSEKDDSSDVMELAHLEEGDPAEDNEIEIDKIDEESQEDLIDLNEEEAIDFAGDAINEIGEEPHDDLIVMEENVTGDAVENIDEKEDDISQEILEPVEELESVEEISDESLDFSEILPETSDDTEDLLTPAELDETSELLELDTSDNISFDDTVDIKSEGPTEFKPTDYSVFNYNPAGNGEEFDEEEIAKSIYYLDRRKPNLNILKVYNLKYKENNSISDIATKLSMEENEVKEAVSELISVV